MPSGDAQRVWFPEMLAELGRRWRKDTSWPELAAICGDMTKLRREIRAARGIEPPLVFCRRCGQASRSDIEGISIRSALFALRKSGRISEEELEELDKSWKEYRAAYRLDRFGKPEELGGVPTTGDHHCG